MTIPSTPIAPMTSAPEPEPKARTSSRALFVLALAILAVVAVVAGAAVAAVNVGRVFTDEMAKVRAEIRDIETMTPPTNDKLFTILSKGIGQSEYQFRPDDVGTTPEAAFGTDLTTTQRTDAFTQEFTIENLHATQNLCWKPIAWTETGATCTLKCAGVAASFTCSGAATDGHLLAPSRSVSRRFDGTSCLCVVGSAAATRYQSERIVR